MLTWGSLTPTAARAAKLPVSNDFKLYSYTLRRWLMRVPAGGLAEATPHLRTSLLYHAEIFVHLFPGFLLPRYEAENNKK